MGRRGSASSSPQDLKNCLMTECGIVARHLGRTLGIDARPFGRTTAWRRQLSGIDPKFLGIKPTSWAISNITANFVLASTWLSTSLCDSYWPTQQCRPLLNSWRDMNLFGGSGRRWRWREANRMAPSSWIRYLFFYIDFRLLFSLWTECDLDAYNTYMFAVVWWPLTQLIMYKRPSLLSRFKFSTREKNKFSNYPFGVPALTATMKAFASRNIKIASLQAEVKTLQGIIASSSDKMNTSAESVAARKEMANTLIINSICFGSFITSTLFIFAFFVARWWAENY